MEIQERYKPLGKYANDGDIIIDCNGNYLLLGWNPWRQEAVTFNLSKESNNVKTYPSMDTVREVYANCERIDAKDIVLSFKK